MRLSEIKQVLGERDIKLTKSLGQNFLHDRNQLLRIADAAELRATDKVLEIGPGLGPLTELLIERAGEVLAIEKDRRLAEVLRERLGPNGKLTLLDNDALAFLQRQSRDWTDWKVVSNLPYSVASPIVVELAQTKEPPERIVATLQLEVAQRLVAVPADADYGILSLLVQLTYQPGRTFKIPASCFFPQPEVDSACITLLRRPQPLLRAKLRPAFAQIVKRSFSQRRKTMLKLLKQDWPAANLDGALRQCALDPQTRAEALSLEHFVQLTKALSDAAS